MTVPSPRANDSGPVKMSKVTPCQLPYPEKFEEALSFFRNGKSKNSLTDETKLILHGLSQQVLVGPCTEKKPWGWNPVEQAKWQAWSHLDKMDRMEAMRLFVKTLEEEEPNWYGVQQEAAAPPPPLAPSPSTGPTLSSMPADNLWKTPWVTADKHPHPRYEHSACVLGNCMYVVGGNCAGGRYLADVWQLKLDTLTWTNTTAAYKSAASDDANGTVPAHLPPCAGMVCIPHRGRILVIGGHTKDKNPKAALVVRVLDPARSAWSVLPCTGDVPRARGGHAACLIADKVYVVGGEDPQRSLATGLHVLDLTTNTWSELPSDSIADEKGQVPSPRSALACAAYQDRYLLLFGGGSAAHCHNDFWVFDTGTSTWERPVIHEPRPLARAGCAAAMLGNTLYVVGGGNNVRGCPDMWTLDMTGLGVTPLRWELACEFDRVNALATEGASLCASPAHGALVAFGGYNGTYHNAVSVYKPGQPAARQNTNDDVAVPPPAALALKPSISAVSAGAGGGEADAAAAAASRPSVSPRSGHAVNGSAAAEKAAAAASSAIEEAMAMKDAVNQELALMRHQLVSAQSAKEAAEAEARDAVAELAAEREKSSKLQIKVVQLEVQITELQEKLQTLGELQAEVDKYKLMLSEKDKSKAGFWGYISGA